jgi:hypothetical protein
MAAKLVGIQNKCLRVVAGAYRATPIQTLEVKTHVPPIDLYFDSRLATFQNRLANSEVGQLIEKACSTIQARIRNRRRRKTTSKATMKEHRREWVGRRTEWIENHSTKCRRSSRRGSLAGTHRKHRDELRITGIKSRDLQTHPSSSYATEIRARLAAPPAVSSRLPHKPLS